MRKSLCTLAALAAIACAPAHAAIDNYFAALLGANEVPPASTGDLDGFGSALVAIDNVAKTVSWVILAQNIAPITLAHIHQAPAGANGPVKVDFNGMVTGSGLFDADLALITPATASGFYVNIHTGEFPGGAIRGQLQYVGTVAAPIPEPETYALMLAGLGVVGLMARRRARPAA
jgi:hypothetical protein